MEGNGRELSDGGGAGGGGMQRFFFTHPGACLSSCLPICVPPPRSC